MTASSFCSSICPSFVRNSSRNAPTGRRRKMKWVIRESANLIVVDTRFKAPVVFSWGQPMGPKVRDHRPRLGVQLRSSFGTSAGAAPQEGDPGLKAGASFFLLVSSLLLQESQKQAKPGLPKSQELIQTPGAWLRVFAITRGTPAPGCSVCSVHSPVVKHGSSLELPMPKVDQCKGGGFEGPNSMMKR